MLRDLDKARSDVGGLEQFVVERIGKPWWQFYPTEYDRELGDYSRGLHPFVKWSRLALVEAKVRVLTAGQSIRRTRLAIGLELHRCERGQYPDSLSALTENHIGVAPVIDPFSGQPFHYELTADGSDYRLWSVGPDKTNEGGDVKYDPTNGTLSAGDGF
ncbi:hypothetical protein HQ520_10110 [bacterium]|nr:hypothetical protein [bacterium]